MGFLQQIKDYFSGITRSGIRYDSDGKPTWFPINFDTKFKDLPRQDIAAEAWGRNPYFHMVIESLSMISAQLERYVVQGDEEIESEVIQIINDRPNPTENGMVFRLKLEQMLRTYGEVFIVGIRPVGFREFGEFYLPNPNNVTINYSGFGTPESYFVTIFNEALPKLSTSDVLHIKYPDIRQDDERGYSPLQAAQYVFRANNKVWESEYHLQKNKGASGVIFTKGGGRPMTDKERDELQKQYDRETQGSEWGKVRISTKELGYLQMGMNAADLKSIEARLDHLRYACSLFGVDSVLYGDTAGSTYNNKTLAEKTRYTNAILPLSNWIDRSISEWLLEPEQKYCVNTNTIKALEETNKQQSDMIIAQVNAGILTPEQAHGILHPDLNFETNDTGTDTEA